MAHSSARSEYGGSLVPRVREVASTGLGGMFRVVLGEPALEHRPDIVRALSVRRELVGSMPD